MYVYIYIIYILYIYCIGKGTSVSAPWVVFQEAPTIGFAVHSFHEEMGLFH